MRVGLLLLAVLLWGCTGEEAERESVEGAAAAWEGLGRLDTVGVVDIAEGDTTSGHSGLTIVETTVKFPPEAAGGEVVGWEFYARALHPVKLVIVRSDERGEQFELVGESRTVIPRRVGVNRFLLREPIPVGFRYMFGLVMPEQEAIPFRKVRNWKTLISPRPLGRLLTPRERFVTYGWRYSVRVFWRRSGGDGE